MENLSLSGKSFSLSPTSKDFIESYLRRIDSFLSARHLSKSYGDDIRERIAEKLSSALKEESPLKDSCVIKIVNEIGEPEDIFSDLEEIRANKDESEVIRLLKHPFCKNREKGIIFGVCAGIADYFEINALWVRLIFIIFTFSWGIGIIVYLALAILLPDVAIETTKSIGNPPLIMKRGMIDQISDMVGGSFRGVFKFLVVCGFAAFGMFLLVCFIGGVMTSGFLLTGGIEIDRQIFPSIIPVELLYTAPILTILSLIVAVAAFASILGKDLFNKVAWIAATGITAITLVFFSMGVFRVVKDYSWQDGSTKQYEFAYSGKTIMLENLANSFNRQKHGISIFGNATLYTSHSISHDDTLTGSIRVEVEETVYTKNTDTAKAVTDAMSDLLVSFSGSKLSITKAKDGDFSQVVPYAFPERRIYITVPKGVKIVYPGYNFEDEEYSD